MKIGIRAHDIKRSSTEELIASIKQYNFDSMQFVLKKAVVEYDFNQVELDYEKSLEIASKCQGVEVAMLGAYFNLVHSNKELVKNGIEYFKKCLKYAEVFGCSLVGTETGSYNDSPWTYHPKNQTEEGFEEAYLVIQELVDYAKTTSACVAIEGAWGHVMYCPQVLKRLYDKINSDHLKIIVDVYNYLNIDNHKQALNILEEALRLFGKNIKIFHIKDYIVQDGDLVQCTIGKGIMPLDEMIPLIVDKCPEATLIFEGSVENDLVFSLNHIRKLIGGINE